MSHDDVVAERDRLAAATTAMTELPLLGMTLGTDGSWSARVWRRTGTKQYSRSWCESVRVLGEGLSTTYCDEVLWRPAFRDSFRRTVTVWGAQNHSNMARLRIGIVGLGSVGAMVAEALARMGMTRFVFIDHDRVERHNLDRLVFADERGVGQLKVKLAAERTLAVATGENVQVEQCPYSIAEEEGYRAALDCDVLFSCVDRPRPRHILNHFAYAHLIPVIDGGIDVRFKKGRFSGADWQVQTVGPGKPCLACLGAYKLDDVSVEAAGMLDNPSYMRGLGDEHRLRRNENVFPFSANLASLEVLQFIALTTQVAGIGDFGIQRFRYVPGILEAWGSRCTDDCGSAELVAQGDRHYHLYGTDLAAERSRRDGAAIRVGDDARGVDRG